MIDKKEKNTLKKHSVHHTAKHMSTMKKKCKKVQHLKNHITKQ